MRMAEWFAQRGIAFSLRRGRHLLGRYGIGSSLARARVLRCVSILAEYNCAPTFPTPGAIVDRSPGFIRRLQEAGAEIAVHGYHHLDLRSYPPIEASEQLSKAVQAFRRAGVEVHGFRCPYLSCTDELLESLPDGLFGYSSNRTMRYDDVLCLDTSNKGVEFDVLHRLYQARSASTTMCSPRLPSGMVEIPVCVPDDIQLLDGLGLDSEGLWQVWGQILRLTHERGEVFTLLFHPELASECEDALRALLQEARRLYPPVWVARLRDISDWWQEKARFGIDICETREGLRLTFRCSPRGTVLARGLRLGGEQHPWGDGYHRVSAASLSVPAEPRPFVGVARNIPDTVSAFLREHGYILDPGPSASRCGIYLDADLLSNLASEVELVKVIEASPGPLVRYSPWPDGAKSALSVTGDLDALSLLDYASRLFAR